MNSVQKYNFKTESYYDKILELLLLEDPQRPENIKKKVGCAHGTLFDNLKKLLANGLITREEKKDKDIKDRERPFSFYSLTMEGYNYIYRKIGRYEYDNVIMRMKFREKSQIVYDFFKKYEIEEFFIPDLIETFLRVESNPEFSGFKRDLNYAIYFLKKNSIQNYPRYLTWEELCTTFDIKIDSPQAKRIEYYLTILEDQYDFESIILDERTFYLDLDDKIGKFILTILNKVIAHETILTELNPSHIFNVQEIISKITENIFTRYSILEIDLQKTPDFKQFLKGLIEKVTPKSLIEKEMRRPNIFEILEPIRQIVSMYFLPIEEKAKLKYSVLSAGMKIPDDLLLEDLHQILFTFPRDDITDIDDEIEKCKKELEIDSQNISKILLLSILYVYDGRYQDALKEINKIEIAKLSPKSQAEVLLFKAKINYQMGEYEKSIKFYRTALKLNFHQTLIWNGIGLLYLFNNEEKAIESFENALEIKENATSYRYLGVAYYRLGDFNNAIKFYEKQFEFEPKNAKDKFDFYLLVEASIGLEKYEKALKYFEDAKELYPDSNVLWNYGGTIFQFLKKDQKALECYQEVIGNFPEDADDDEFLDYISYRITLYGEKHEVYLKNALSQTVRIYIKLENYETALAYIEKALKAFPENGYFWFTKGEIHLLHNESEKAAECFLKFLEPVHSLLPDGLRTKMQDYIWSQKGHMLYFAGNLEKALENYQKSLEINPNNIFVWKIVGNIYYALGENARAIDCFKRVLEINPKNEKVKKTIREVEKGIYKPPYRSYYDFYYDLP